MTNAQTLSALADKEQAINAEYINTRNQLEAAHTAALAALHSAIKHYEDCMAERNAQLINGDISICTHNRSLARHNTLLKKANNCYEAESVQINEQLARLEAELNQKLDELHNCMAQISVAIMQQSVEAMKSVLITDKDSVTIDETALQVLFQSARRYSRRHLIPDYSIDNNCDCAGYCQCSFEDEKPIKPAYDQPNRSPIFSYCCQNPPYPQDGANRGQHRAKTFSIVD